MSLLEQIRQGKQPSPRRLMIYGPHGVGKSTFAAAAPKPIFIPTEDGLGDIDTCSFRLATSYEQVIAAIGELYSQEHEFQTVVIDSADWLATLVHADVCKKRGVENIEEIGFAKGYTFALQQWREVLDGLDALRNKRGMTVVVLAHAKIERFEHPEVDTFDRYVPRLHKLASQLLQEWHDEVLFANFRVHTSTADAGFGRKRTRGIGTGERILRTSERPAHVAKNRLGLPEELPLDWKAYAQFCSNDV